MFKLKLKEKKHCKYTLKIEMKSEYFKYFNA